MNEVTSVYNDVCLEVFQKNLEVILSAYSRFIPWIPDYICIHSTVYFSVILLLMMW